MSDLKSVGIKCEKLKMGFALEDINVWFDNLFFVYLLLESRGCQLENRDNNIFQSKHQFWKLTWQLVEISTYIVITTHFYHLEV